jgi:glucokinase
MTKYSIGIDIGATTVKLGVVTASGKITYQKEMKTDALRGPEQFIERLAKTTKELIRESKIKRDQCKGIGIGCPSWDGYREVVGEAHNLPGFKGLAIGKIIARESNFPTFVDNDANAAVEGERIFGGWGEASQNIVVYTLGTGVGGGVIHTDPRTGIPAKITGYKLRGAELGHITIALPPGKKSRKCTCGHPDCLEAHASATAVKEIAKEKVKKLMGEGKKTRIIEMVGKDPSLQESGIGSKPDGEKIEHIEAKHVALAAAEGDKLSLEIEDETASALAEGIHNVVQAFDPQIVVIAGKMGMRWGRMVGKAITKYRAAKGGVVLPGEVRIEISRLENPGILGAAALATSEDREK